MPSISSPLSFLFKIMPTYPSPYCIGITDDVMYKGKQYAVYLNYIKGETDAKGYTPTENKTVLIDKKDWTTKITCLDYKKLEVIKSDYVLWEED